MSIYTDKVLLIIGGGETVTASFVEHIVSEGAKEVRILGENETAMQSLRDEITLKLEPLKPETRQRVRFYVGDVADNAFMAEAMGERIMCSMSRHYLVPTTARWHLPSVPSRSWRP